MARKSVENKSGSLDQRVEHEHQRDKDGSIYTHTHKVVGFDNHTHTGDRKHEGIF